MTDFISANTYEERLRHTISVAWALFSRKVGANLIPVYKEASMQLQYAYILRQLLPLASHAKHEVAEIELETGVRTLAGSNKVDILLKCESILGQSSIAIELKCYRTLTSSGGKRGAHNIFMKDVYEDLNILEDYVSQKIVNRGVALVMNDLEYFVNPKIKQGKCWAYDISNNNSITGANLSVPIGGKKVSVQLEKSYEFKWSKFGDLWFMELEGV